MSDQVSLHADFAAHGTPVTVGDLLCWLPTGVVVRVTSSTGLCMVRLVSAPDEGPEFCLHLATRRLLHWTRPQSVPVAAIFSTSLHPAARGRPGGDRLVAAAKPASSRCALACNRACSRRHGSARVMSVAR